MPNYIIQDETTGEIDEVFCSYEDLKTKLNSNPNLKQLIGAPKLIGGVSRDGGSLPDGFKDKLKEMKKKHPMATGMDHLI